MICCGTPTNPLNHRFIDPSRAATANVAARFIMNTVSRPLLCLTVTCLAFLGVSLFPVITPLPKQETADGWLEQMSRRLGHSRPRKFPFFQRLNNHMEPPPWLKLRQEDPLHSIYQFQKELFSMGEAVWGFLLQGHEDLFEPERDNHAALLLYGDPSRRVALPELAATAGRIAAWLDEAQLGGPHPTFRRLLLDPHGRVFGQPVPEELLGDPASPVYCSSIMVHREHVSPAWLPFAWLPLLVLPHQPFTATLLPHWYWPQGFQDRWSERALFGLKAGRS